MLELLSCFRPQAADRAAGRELSANAPNSAELTTQSSSAVSSGKASHLSEDAQFKQVELEEARWARAALEATSSLQVVVTDTGSTLGSSGWLSKWNPVIDDQLGVQQTGPSAPSAEWTPALQTALANIVGPHHAAAAASALCHKSQAAYRARIVFQARPKDRGTPSLPQQQVQQPGSRNGSQGQAQEEEAQGNQWLFNSLTDPSPRIKALIEHSIQYRKSRSSMDCRASFDIASEQVSVSSGFRTGPASLSQLQVSTQTQEGLLSRDLVCEVGGPILQPPAGSHSQDAWFQGFCPPAAAQSKEQEQPSAGKPWAATAQQLQHQNTGSQFSLQPVKEGVPASFPAPHREAYASISGPAGAKKAAAAGPAPPAATQQTAPASPALSLKTMDVTVQAFMHEGRRGLLVTGQDVSQQMEAEGMLVEVADAQLTLLADGMPRHVLDFFTTAPHLSHDQVPYLIPTLARNHSGVSLLFMDIKGFTTMSKVLKPVQVMATLNKLFALFDRLVDLHGVHKVETAGDCYIASCGILEAREDGFLHVVQEGAPRPQAHARRMLAFARDMLAASRTVIMPHNGEPITVRIGLHTGDAVSGLIGSKLPKFSIFGDVMNTASRMESTAPPGRIQASADFQALLPEEPWEATQGVEVKGKGFMQTYLFSALRPSLEAQKQQQQQQQPPTVPASALLGTGGEDQGGGSMFSSSLQRLLLGPSVYGAARGSITKSKSYMHLESSGTEAWGEQAGPAPPHTAPGLCTGAFTDGWQLATVDPLFLNMFNTFRNVAAAHLGAQPAGQGPVARRAWRRSSMPDYVNASMGPTPDRPGTPVVSAATYAVASSYTGTGMGATRPSSFMSYRSGHLTTGSPATSAAGNRRPSGFERSPSGLMSGSLWNALLTTQYTTTLPQLEAARVSSGSGRCYTCSKTQELLG